MTSTNNNNPKNQVDTTDLEFGSFNEEEDQFINKKQLVHIDDDTSINVDISEDDRSKSSSFKKSFLINNISAFNEQFQPNNKNHNKKNDNYNNENELNDMTNSADFYNSQNGIGNFPLASPDINKEKNNKKNNENNDINNDDDVIQSLETKIINNGFYFQRKNKENIENNNNNNGKNNNNNMNFITNKKININNKEDNNISIKDIDDEEEIEELEEEFDNPNNINTENNKNNTRTSQMMIKKKLTPNDIINKYITNQNITNYNEEFLQNMNSNGGKSANFNSNDFNINADWQQENFNFNIMSSVNKFGGSVNTSEQTFGLLQSREFQNKYTQLESKYNSLLAQNKKLEENYQELKNSNKSVLDLLTYWQKFYLEILEIVKPKEKSQNKNDTSINDYMDDPYRIQVINDVKKIVLISRDKAYNIFHVCQTNKFDIKSKKENIENKNDNNNIINNNIKNINLNLIQIESFYYKGEEKKELNNDKNYKKYISKDDDINSLPPIRHIERINTGMNTDISGEEKPVIKEIVIKKYNNKNLNILSKVQNISYINKISKKRNSKMKEINPEIISEFKILKINSNINLNYKGIKPKNSQNKFKRNIMHKIAIVQTDLTYKNINSIETLNKACSSQLLNSQREKEKMQKLYEEKIASLNSYINENIKPAKKEKEKNKINKNKEKEKEEREKENKIKEDNNIPNLNSSFIFLPEMIPPENTYKIFIHCVKHFKYEEEIYKKYLEEEDLYTLKAFVEKMEKYLIGASLPLLKNNKKIKKENISKEKKSNTISHNNININDEFSLQKKYKENTIIHNVKQKFSNSKLKVSNNSDNKSKGGENKIHNIY